MALVRWWPKASLSWGEDYGEGVEAMGDVFEKVESEGVDEIEVCELGQGFLAGVCVEDCFFERVFGEGWPGTGSGLWGRGRYWVGGSWRLICRDVAGKNSQTLGLILTVKRGVFGRRGERKLHSGCVVLL